MRRTPLPGSGTEIRKALANGGRASARGTQAGDPAIDELLPTVQQAFEARLALLGAKFADHLMYVVYPKYLGPADAQEIARFYGTPAGTKLLRLTPAILAERRQTDRGDGPSRHFTEAELKEIQQFAWSPAGARMQAVGSVAQQEMRAFFVREAGPMIEDLVRGHVASASTQPGPAARGAASAAQ